MLIFSLLTMLGSFHAATGPLFWNYIADTVQGASGTVTIQAPLASISLTSHTIAYSLGGANITDANPQPAVTAAGSETWFSATVHDTGGLSDIDGVTIFVYKSNHAPSIGSPSTTFNATSDLAFRWVKTSYTLHGDITTGDACSASTNDQNRSPHGCFQELTGSGGFHNSLTYLVTTTGTDTSRPTWSSPGPTSGTWTFAVTLQDMAPFTAAGATTHWVYYFSMTQRTSPFSTSSDHPSFDMNMYDQVGGSAVLGFNNATALTPGATLQSMGSASWGYASNVPLTIQVRTEADPNDGTNDTIPSTAMAIGTTTPCTIGTNCMNLLAATNYVTYQANALPQLNPAYNNMYWYMSPPSVIVPGQYTFTWDLTLSWDSVYPV
jgi:hypothetical protein